MHILAIHIEFLSSHDFRTYIVNLQYMFLVISLKKVGAVSNRAYQFYYNDFVSIRLLPAYVQLANEPYQLPLGPT